MRAKHLSVPVAVAALALAAAPVAPAVTLPAGLLTALHSSSRATVSDVGTQKSSKRRSCQVGDERSRIKLAGPEPVRETERRSATTACEQPPKSNLNLNSGLKGAEASALVAAG
jgi:hypothetical protein